MKMKKWPFGVQRPEPCQVFQPGSNWCRFAPVDDTSQYSLSLTNRRLFPSGDQTMLSVRLAMLNVLVGAEAIYRGPVPSLCTR